MTRRELDAAGITDPALRTAYTRCRRLNARHGRTYFLATRLLPVERRSAVHALYGFARWADDIVDDLDRPRPPEERDLLLRRLEGDLAHGLRTGGGDEPVVRAVADTSARYGIEHTLFADFLASMRSDLHVTDYPTYADLRTYMHGSAAVIGLQMLPVLGTVTSREEAAPHAADLGVAFQLTNFLRDVGEDLDRGRVYLPADLLAAHGVDRPLLEWSRRTGRRDARIHAAFVAAEAMTRKVYRAAEPGIAMLDPRVRPCIRTAFVLYRGILDAIAEQGYTVLHRRAVVSRGRRAATAAAGAVHIVRARHRARTADRALRAPGGSSTPGTSGTSGGSDLSGGSGAALRRKGSVR
ncbi:MULTISPECIES: phytoene/squalene synthase family protein [Streptomyces]|uniref:Phytoene/squalene synthase family protein n=2 Tax=Streptomyces prasinus TaxID=67345 RepID=A0ABX6B4U1_9ACTN|nr:phytoene/squalene synthase family protein [Streptomyces prasinus]QEV09111.1 phytoene/squalene synthase family protein [Streptomyces prasinus]